MVAGAYCSDMAPLYDSDRRVEERLARHESRGPRRGQEVGDDREVANGSGDLGLDEQHGLGDSDEFTEFGEGGGGSASSLPGSSLRSLPRVPGQRRAFGRRQLLVITALVALGLLLAGWAVLRARPVALASPISEPTTQTAGKARTPAPSTASPAPTAASSDERAAPPTRPTSTSAPPVGSASSSPPATQIEVHVLGAVRHPGVVRLAVGARVADALRSAGGLTGSASPGRLNLAQPLVDGQQLYLARKGRGASGIRDPRPAVGADPGPAASDGAAAAGSGAGSGGAPASATAAGSSTTKVNLNQASETDLDQLPGIGPVTAGKIIAWRTEHGRFNKIEELQEVDGIGPKTYADLAGRVTL